MKGILVFVIGFISFGAFAIVDADLPSNTKGLMEYERNNLAKVIFIRVSDSSDSSKNNLAANIYVNKNLRGQLVQEGLSTLYFCPGTYPIVSLLQNTKREEFPQESSVDQSDMIYTFLPGKEYYFLLNDHAMTANIYQEQLVSANTAFMRIKALSKDYPMTNFLEQVNDRGYVSCETDKAPIHHILTLLPSEPTDVTEPLPLKALNSHEKKPVIYNGLIDVSSETESALDFNTGKPANGDTLIIKFDAHNQFLMDHVSFNKVVDLLRSNRDLAIDIAVDGGAEGTVKERKAFASERAYIVLNALRNNGIMHKRIAKVRSVIDVKRMNDVNSPNVLVTVKYLGVNRIVMR